MSDLSAVTADGEAMPVQPSPHRHLIVRHVHPEWHGHCDPMKRGHKRCNRPHWHFLWRHSHMPRRDRAGFRRRFGVGIVESSGVPWASLGIHIDWHTPTIDLYLGRITVQVGRNQHAERFTFDRFKGTGHTDQCLCQREAA